MIGAAIVATVIVVLALAAILRILLATHDGSVDIELPEDHPTLPETDDEIFDAVVRGELHPNVLTTRQERVDGYSAQQMAGQVSSAEALRNSVIQNITDKARVVETVEGERSQDRYAIEHAIAVANDPRRPNMGAEKVEGMTQVQQMREAIGSLQHRLEVAESHTQLALAGPNADGAAKSAVQELLAVREVLNARGGEATIDAVMRVLGTNRVIRENGLTYAGARSPTGLVIAPKVPMPIGEPVHAGLARDPPGSGGGSRDPVVARRKSRSRKARRQVKRSVPSVDVPGP